MVSIVVPMHNEAPNVAPLVAGLATACAGFDTFEVILVNDGSTDQTAAAVQAAQATHSWLRCVTHAQAGGQSAAIHSGVQAARGTVICTLDGDGQNPPDQVPYVLAPLLNPDAGTIGLVAGQRVGRKDTLSKRLASQAANGLRARLLRDGTRDTGCGLKAFRRDAFLALPYFNHMHRYLPALFTRDGWQVAHVDVTHAPRQAGRSKYTNLGRAVVGIYDLIGVAWLIRRRKRVTPIDPRGAS